MEGGGRLEFRFTRPMWNSLTLNGKLEISYCLRPSPPKSQRGRGFGF